MSILTCWTWVIGRKLPFLCGSCVAEYGKPATFFKVNLPYTQEAMTGTRWQSILYICDTVSALLVEKFQFRWFFLNKIDLSHDNQYILIHLGVLSYYMWFICVKKKENWLGFIKGCESLYHKNNSLIVSGVLHAWRKCIENCLSFSSKVYCVMPWNLKIKTLFGNYFLK